jgi:hypothetical protein
MMPTIRMIRGERALLALGTACLLGAAGVLLAHHGSPVTGPPPAPTQWANVGPAAPAALDRADPVRISIPAIRVDRPLLALGLTPAGALATPPMTRADTPGWYRGSPTPGNQGPAVIVGHVDSLTGPAVFWNLSTLKPGQLVVVDRSDHLHARFRITRVQAFPKARFPSQAVYGRLGYAGLRLITCGGPYDAARGGYQDNTIVFARLVRLG